MARRSVDDQGRREAGAERFEQLRASRGRSDDADAFIRDPDRGGGAVSQDDLAETLGEDFVFSATSGQDVDNEVLEQVVPEELGGPFIETSANEEFAAGTDESNPADAEPEPLPRATHGLTDRQPEE